LVLLDGAAFIPDLLEEDLDSHLFVFVEDVDRVVQSEEVFAELFEGVAALLAPAGVAEVSAMTRANSSEQDLQQMYAQEMHSTGSQASFSQKKHLKMPAKWSFVTRFRGMPDISTAIIRICSHPARKINYRMTRVTSLCCTS
jgi:hypothetical protein